MNVLLTGGLGFIGSHFVEDTAASHKVTVYDKATYASRNKLRRKHDRLVIGDLCDREKLLCTCIHQEISYIVHMAAESSVDKSIKGCDEFIDSNIRGTVTVLEVCRDLGIPILYMSTDETYGALGPDEDPWTEDAPRKPRNPYAASKAAAEMFVDSYVNTYGVKAITVRASNNYGPGQHSEKFLPTLINSIRNSRPVPIYGDGLQKREWIYVKDTVMHLQRIMLRGTFGERYNIGTGYELTNLEVVAEVGKAMGVLPVTTSVPDRLGHDRRYCLNTDKLDQLWQPTEDDLCTPIKPHTTFKQGIFLTLESFK